MGRLILDRGQPTERTIGAGEPVLVVAEMSCNHAGSLIRAHAIVDAAAEAGCGAVKVQIFDPIRLARLRGGVDVPAPAPWSGVRLGELYRQAQTPTCWLRELFSHIRVQGMVPIASVFSIEDIQTAIDVGAGALKTAAPEWAKLVIGPGILPVIASVPAGADLEGYAAIESRALLHCPGDYPASCDQLNLRQILALRRHASVVGLSDHSRCEATAIAAVALGIDLLEVHVMLEDDRYDMPPLDAAFSWRPIGLLRLVTAVRHTEASL